ncbi:hypothetical protein HPP05_31985, partial [Corallococcus exiguus]|uniref:hypothetical protein n=1 Tax=Corallococcus exiguus TaxID=83462 RepID=UPI001494BCA5
MSAALTTVIRQSLGLIAGGARRGRCKAASAAASTAVDTLERELVALRAQVEAVRPLVDWARATLELRDEADDAQTHGHVIVLDVRGKARVSVTVEQLRAAVAEFPPPAP